ncbi:protogenin A-like [Babylonia areolata]|uniref:protogenin A-like n=1 Tax=Babylonia areolata TaxID=304850 RepID=UPI003FD054FF
MERGIHVGVFFAVTLLCGGLSAQDDYDAMDGSFLDDHTDDLEAGLGLLAEQRVVVTVRRSSVYLDCAVAAEPQFGNLTYTWNISGHKIQSRSPRRYTFPNGTLHIRKVKAGTRVSDEGMYECFVTNSIGTVIAQRIQLVVASLGKRFVQEGGGGRHGVGSNVYLPCQITSTPSDLLVVWQKDSSLLKIDDNPRYRQIHGGLLIMDAQVNDSGSYHCQVTNNNFFNFVDNNPNLMQWRNSRPALLHIIDENTEKSPPFLLTPDNVTEVLLGDPVELLCASSTFLPHAITWTRADADNPDVRVPVETSAEFSLLPCGSLQIIRASRNHAGIYTCTHTAAGISMSTVLHVLEAPVIEDSSPSSVYPLASIIRLDCLCAGQPPPSVLWLKNGVQVSPVRYRVEFLKEALLIYQGNTEDSGYYQCLVKNKAGWALSLTRVAVRIQADAPPAPCNVTGEALSSTRILVRWDMDPSSQNLLSYSIHRRLAQEKGGAEAEIVDKKQQEAVLYGLTPDTLYAITIRAYNKGGASPSSPPIFIRTDLTGYPSPVLSFASNSSIFLNWSDFHTRHRRKLDISSYQVSMVSVNSGHVDQIVLHASQDTLLLTDLQENREYRVRMKAIFKGDDSDVHDESWPWGYVRTGNASLPTLHTHLAAPFNLRGIPLEPNAISLSWTYSSENLEASLPVTHYTVRCQRLETHFLGIGCQDTAAQSVIMKVSHSNLATLNNLKAFTLYNISVSAHSDNLQGPYSHSILVQTKEDVPSRPEDLEAEVVSEGQVHLRWQPPTLPNGLIQGHYIKYVNQKYHVMASTSDITNTTWEQIFQHGNKTQATVNNLKKRFYIFQVQACTNAGRGEPSMLVFVHMGDNPSRSGLSDQHLGILGGSVIGLTSIVITVIVIICKQRQLKKQLESQYLMEQRRHMSALAHDLQSPMSLTLQLTPSTIHSEELEKLLSGSTPFTTSSSINAVTAVADTDSRDSGCSSTPPNHTEESSSDNIIQVADDDDGVMEMDGKVTMITATSNKMLDSVIEQRETTC